MKLPRNMLAGVCCLITASAFAQEDTWTPGTYMTQSLNSCFDAGQVFLEDTNYGYDDDGISLVGTYMQPYGYYTLTKFFQAKTSYVVIAAGDEDATNVNLHVRNLNGEIVASDPEVDRLAIVEFTPKVGEDFSLEVELFEANTASFVSFVILRDGGWTIPRSDLELAQSTLMSRGAIYNQAIEEQIDVNLYPSGRYLRFNDGASQACVFGGLIAGGDGAYLTNLNLGEGDVKLIAEGDSDVEDIDLILYDAYNTELNSDRLGDAHPVIDHYTLASQNYHIEIANEAASDSTPTFCMVGVMQVRP